MVIRSLLLYLLMGIFSLYAQQTTKTETPFITLEPLFSGTSPLYPGQQAWVGYRYKFNASIDLTQEVLPLLEAKGFRKLGEKRIDETERNGLNVHQVLQKIEALEPGDYAFGPSIVTGFAYTAGSGGQKVYDPTPLKSEVPTITLTVAAFPQEERPAFFNGALGNFSLKTELLSSSQVNLGERIDLLLKVTGDGEWDTVKPPNLCCQPGFSGFFRSMDLPPIASLEGQTKTFQIAMFVENRDSTAIPSIAFAFFNSKDHKYGVNHSEPISLQVSAPPIQVDDETIKLSPLINLSDSFPLPLSFPWRILLLPLSISGLMWIAFQTHYQTYKKTLETYSQPPLSLKLYQEALQEKSHEEVCFTLLEKALRSLLSEKKLIAHVDLPLNEIPDEGEAKPIKQILEQIERKRFLQVSLTTDEALQSSQRFFA